MKVRVEREKVAKEKKGKEERKVAIDQILFLIGIFAKQFYLLSSGSLQIGDILLMCSFLFCFFVRRKGYLHIRNDDYYYIGFVICVLLINGINFIVYSSYEFIVSTLYYLFNMMIVLVFSAYIHSENSPEFLGGLRKVLQLGLLMQGLMYFSEIGQWYGGSRYVGTFNDPNQYGVFVFFSVLIIYMIGDIFEKKSWFWILLGLFLTFPCASTGVLVGYVAFFGALFVIKILYRATPRKVIVGLILAVVAVFLAIFLWLDYIKLPEFITDMSVYDRLVWKVKTVIGGSSSNSILSDRGWERLLTSPEYILLGAGEGAYSRFGTILEVHSSIFGPLFNYGILPFLLLVGWCLQKVKRVRRELLCVYFGLIAECLFLVNTRQPMFWMIISLASVVQAKQFTLKSASKDVE